MLKDSEAQNSQELTRLLIARGIPHKEAEQPFQTYRVSQLGLHRSQLGALLDELLPEVTKSKNVGDLKAFRDNLKSIIFALGAAGYAFEWMVLPMQDKHYNARERLGRLGLSRRRVTRILEALDGADLLIRGRKGFKDNRLNYQSKASQFFPSPKLMEYFASCLYEFEEEFDVDVYRYNGFPAGTLTGGREVDDGVALLTRYNAFMRQFSWARKGPTHRTFSGTMQRGGRLINGFQNIVKHRVPIRPKTLLDGSPIAEPDFSANHLRMSGALLGEELPTDPYADLAQITGGTREQVKAFLTMALGALSPAQIGGGMKTLRESDRVPVSTELFNELRDAFPRLHPWIRSQKVFFNDTGARMQVYEGNIAMCVYAEALKAGKPVLAVHDAFAVRQQDEPWAKEVMRQAWKSELNTLIEPVIT